MLLRKVISGIKEEKRLLSIVATTVMNNKSFTLITAPKVQDAVAKAADDTKVGKVILDLRGVDDFDSFGAGICVFSQDRVERMRGKELVIIFKKGSCIDEYLTSTCIKSVLPFVYTDQVQANDFTMLRDLAYANRVIFKASQ